MCQRSWLNVCMLPCSSSSAHLSAPLSWLFMSAHTQNMLVYVYIFFGIVCKIDNYNYYIDYYHRRHRCEREHQHVVCLLHVPAKRGIRINGTHRNKKEGLEGYLHVFCVYSSRYLLHDTSISAIFPSDIHQNDYYHWIRKTTCHICVFKCVLCRHDAIHYFGFLSSFFFCDQRCI